MSNTSFEVSVTSDVDRDDVYVEISYGDGIFAELSYDPHNDRISTEIFQRFDGSDWVFEICELQEALERARKRMLVLQQPLPAEAPAD